MGESYFSSEMQLVYSTAPADWATEQLEFELTYYNVAIQPINHFAIRNPLMIFKRDWIQQLNYQ